VDDNTQEFKLQISIFHTDEFFEEDQTFELIESKQKEKPEVSKKKTCSIN